MSMWNSADVQIEIKLKNNTEIKTIMSVSGKNLWPILETVNDSAIEEINSGKALLDYIYFSYFPHSSASFESDDDVYFDNGNVYCEGYEDVVAIQNFDLVKSISMKEKVKFEEGGTQSWTYNINQTNSPFIKVGTPINHNEINYKKSTLPKSIKTIGKNAFLGCKKLKIFVEENSPAHTSLKKHKMPHYVISRDNS